MMDELPTQADRQAAAELIERYWSGADESMMKLARSYRAGHSHGAFVRAMQAHRIASNTEAADLISELAEALREAREYVKQNERVLITPLIVKIDTALAKATQ